MEPLLIAAAVLSGIIFLKLMNKRKAMGSIVGKTNVEEITDLSELETFFTSTENQKRLLYLHDPW